jgi:LPS sulfotransferase NodH
MWIRHWGLRETVGTVDYLRTVLAQGISENGVFGMKIQWMHVETLSRELGLGRDEDVLEVLWPGARFINIIRRDRRAQALSWFRAIETGEWWRFREDRTASVTPPHLRRDYVQSLEDEIERQQTAWVDYFARRGIEPLRIEYEDLAADYRGQVTRALAFLDLDPRTAASIPEPRLMRQADGITERWRVEMTG